LELQSRSDISRDKSSLENPLSRTVHVIEAREVSCTLLSLIIVVFIMSLLSAKQSLTRAFGARYNKPSNTPSASTEASGEASAEDLESRDQGQDNDDDDAMESGDNVDEMEDEEVVEVEMIKCDQIFSPVPIPINIHLMFL
jgi:hypothetical protein